VSQKKDLPIRMPDEIAGGVYANQMIVQHTREEFVLDFLSVFPPGGVVRARVLASPAHVKRMIAALTDNLRKYEAQYGPVGEVGPAPVVPGDPMAN